jgi:hypothetical protein
MKMKMNLKASANTGSDHQTAARSGCNCVPIEVGLDANRRALFALSGPIHLNAFWRRTRGPLCAHGGAA